MNIIVCLFFFFLYYYILSLIIFDNSTCKDQRKENIKTAILQYFIYYNATKL